MYKLLKISFLAAMLIVVAAGCTKDQVPAYIRVQTYTIKDSLAQGTTSGKISDVWVNVGTDNRGAYEMPVSVPLLYSGMQTIYLQAGVKENGVSQNRLPYPFFQTWSANVNLVPGKIDTLKPVYKYTSNTKFAWPEGDFEGSGAVLNLSAQNTAIAHSISVKDSVFEGNASYEVDLSQGHDTFDIISNRTFTPGMNVPVWLEMNYKTDVPMDIGALVSISGQGTPTEEFIAGVNATDHWNKIYINFGPTLQYWYGQGTAFKVYFHAVNPHPGTGHILIDNLKLLYFE